MRPSYLLLLLPVLISSTGSSCSTVVDSQDPTLGRQGELITLAGKPFSGRLRVAIPALRQVHLTTYKGGLAHGEATEVTESGKLVARRRYFRGLKHGVHETWHDDGKRMTYARFYLGRYVGDVWAWHSNGRPSDFARYNEQGQIVAQKRWRPTGKIYMNVAFAHGATLGLPGSKVCDPIPEAKQR